MTVVVVAVVVEVWLVVGFLLSLRLCLWVSYVFSTFVAVLVRFVPGCLSLVAAALIHSLCSILTQPPALRDDVNRKSPANFIFYFGFPDYGCAIRNPRNPTSDPGP